MRNLRHPPRLLWEPIVRNALLEDLGLAGDVTTDAVVEEDATGEAVFVARQGGRVAGLRIACATLEMLDPNLVVEIHLDDGRDAAAGSPLATVGGQARALLSGERVALNLLGHLSGIATRTRDIVAAIAPAIAKVVCTRKTTPGLRVLEKYAVRAGGGGNHRFGLNDAILLKDNHKAFAGGLKPAIERLRRHHGHTLKVEVEVDDLDEFDTALALGIDIILLDNMSVEQLNEAVKRNQGRALLEASGGINRSTAGAIAATGVDVLSIGSLTHSSPALDVALDWR